ncbi:hypothetical protein JZ751_020944 [Albula glossodonta]|uniref:G-protein coupled receptors family 2 profile 2 domain-containing protein n=1 Tax=Albula glossodonta TaxID=121402 RepID=A0A8T2PJZ4_9TELE|nr:hypothetical protein JZ751_020944 [Albula glossodonta]
MAVLELIKLYFLVQVASTSGPTSEHCHSVLDSCAQKGNAWARCYEEGMRSCTRRGRRAMNSHVLDFFQNDFNASSDVEHTNNVGHSVYIPSEALVGSARSHVSRNTRVTVTVFNSSLFHAEYWPNKTILGGTVLGVTVGNGVRNLNRPVRMSFGRINENTDVPIDKVNARALSYISYVGCGLSVFFSAIAILMQLCVRNGRSENSMIIHLNLTGALFFLHLFFLLSAWWAGRGLGEDKGGVPCQALGLLLHYSLLATFTWTAIEAFHLYMLLVRIFNIYVKRYLVKLGLVGWGESSVQSPTSGWKVKNPSFRK